MSAWQRRRAAAKEEGATAVEFALIFPLVVLVCFFALYGGLFFFYSAVADHVARTVARQVSIPVGATGTTYPDANPATVVSDAKSAWRCSVGHRRRVLLYGLTSRFRLVS